MINLFSDEFIAGIACSKERKLCLDRGTILSVHLQLYAGDIRTPFSVSSRCEIYGAHFEELVDSVAESIRRLKKALKKDNSVCIWYSEKEADEYLAMLAFVEWLTEKGAVIYLCDYTEACPDLNTNRDCEFLFRPEMHLLTNEERTRYLTELKRLKNENTKLRVFSNGRIVSLPEDRYDERILEVIGEREMKTIMVYPELWDEMPLMLTFILYRIRCLIASEVLEVVREGKIESGMYGAGDDFGKTIVRKKRKE